MPSRLPIGIATIIIGSSLLSACTQTTTIPEGSTQSTTATQSTALIGGSGTMISPRDTIDSGETAPPGPRGRRMGPPRYQENGASPEQNPVTPNTNTTSSGGSSAKQITPQATQANTSQDASNTPTTTATASSKTSTKTKTLSYNVPHGMVSTKYTLTLDGDTVQSVSATMTSGDHESAMYHSRFNSSIASKVVGKKLSQISSFSAVGGASLTTDAFNQFIESI